MSFINMPPSNSVSIDVLSAIGTVIAQYYHMEVDQETQLLRCDEFAKVSASFQRHQWYNKRAKVIEAFDNVADSNFTTISPDVAQMLHVPVAALYHAMMQLGFGNETLVAVAASLQPRAPTGASMIRH